MRKIRILGIAPYRGLVTLMRQCAAQYTDIELHVVLGNMEEGRRLALKAYEQYDIIISRANTANMIANAVPISVVDLGIDYYDVLRCIKMAEHTGTKFALLGFQSLTDTAKNLCDLLQMKIDIFSFSPTDWADHQQLLDHMKELGYKTVICDMIPYNYAKLIGITPILLTSSAESVKTAIDSAVASWKKQGSLYRALSVMRRLLGACPDRCLALDEQGNLLYSNLPAEEEEVVDRLKAELPASRSKQRSFFLSMQGQLYAVRSIPADDLTTLFFLQPSKIPLSYSKYGIRIMDCEEARQSFLESFYSNTELAREIISATEAMAPADAGLMICGEVGTGKDRVAHLCYAKSAHRDNPLYVINCALLNDKTWSFVTNHYNSPLTDNGNTIYISNLEALSQVRQKQLLSLILDTNLHVRNRLIFSCMQLRNGQIPHVALEFSNALGCIFIPVRPLREQRADIAPSAALYIDTLNQQLGRQVVGLDADAAALLSDYAYPGNRTQFKRILKKAVLQTREPYISAETVRKLLAEENALFPSITAAKPDDLHELPESGEQCKRAADGKAEALFLNLDQPLELINRQIIRQVVKNCGGNQSAAAKKLGISRTTLWRNLNA